MDTTPIHRARQGRREPRPRPKKAIRLAPESARTARPANWPAVELAVVELAVVELAAADLEVAVPEEAIPALQNPKVPASPSPESAHRPPALAHSLAELPAAAQKAAQRRAPAAVLHREIMQTVGLREVPLEVRRAEPAAALPVDSPALPPPPLHRGSRRRISV